MKQLSRLVVAAAALVAAVSFGAFAAGVDLGGPLADGLEGGVDFSGAGVSGTVPVTVTITSPSSDPSAVSGTPTTVSGTTTGTISSVTWSTAPASASGSCSTGAGTFSCSVTQAQAAASSQTVTVTANGSVTDTTVVNFPTFDLASGSTTPNDLSDSLTVNSVAMTLVLACDAQGVSGTSWACRDGSGAVTLSEAGAGASPTKSILTPFHALDSAERIEVYPTAAHFRHDAASSAVADLTTDDLVFEYVGTLTSNSTTTNNTVGKKAAAAGWNFNTATSAHRMIINDGTTGVTASGPAACPVRVLCHTMAFIDRNEASTNGFIVYSNGSAGTGQNPSAVGSLTNALTFSIGSTEGQVIGLRIWRCSGCMAGGATNPTQWASIARERTSVAYGARPTLAVGTAAPSALTRASTAFADVIDGTTRAVHNFGNAAPRTARRAAGGTASAGYLAEPQTTNLALQSETLGTTWTAITVGDNVLANAFAGADLATTGDNIDGNDSSGTHGLRQAITLSATTHTFSAWAKAGEKTWVALRDNTIANGSAFFDTTACAACSLTAGDCTSAVGTKGAGVSQAVAQRYPVDTTGDGVADVELCRVSITFTGTAASHDMDLLCAAGDNSLTYTDSGAAADCGFWGAEVEAYPTMTSYQATTTASVTRSADVLSFDGASNVSTSGTIAVSMLCPNFDVATTSKVGVRVDANNFFDLNIDATNDRPGAEMTTAGVAQAAIVGSSGDVADGSVHETRLTYATNALELWYDGVSVGTDTSATMLSSLASSTLGIGHLNSLLQSGCIHTRTRSWAVTALPAVAP